MQERVDAAMDHMADVIKDALLDGLGADGRPEGEAPAVPPALPPIPTEAFVELMRARVEETLRQVAEAISAAPGDAVLAASEEETCDLFTELWLEALRTGVRMRLDAAEAEKPADDEDKGPGEWARRYRRMHAGDESE
jgi:hypothetical protein